MGTITDECIKDSGRLCYGKILSSDYGTTIVAKRLTLGVVRACSCHRN